jgi:adenylate cyclase class 2
MPPRKSNQEIEIKLPVTDIASIRQRLRSLHAREIIPRTYESNTLYDTPGEQLRRRGQLIRIRIEQPARGRGRTTLSHDEPAILTFKGPQPVVRQEANSLSSRRNYSRFKIKEEAEIVVSSASAASRILSALGLRPGFRYEKFRTTYALRNIPGVKIELDETPVGIFLELEGTASAIDRAATLLGYDRGDYSTETYGSLYLAKCRRQGRKPGNMLFPPTRKLRKCPLFP